MIFEQNLEENLVSLHEELNSGSYQPRRSLCFIVEKPKLREIFAADFRDRVVHHVLVGHLEPQWERRIEAFLSAHLSLRLNERRKLRPVSDGIDFLGYIVRTDYLLVRGRVVDALRWRLRQTEDGLIQLGMKNFPAGRMVYPWPWILLERTRQCLNSYLAHFERASCQSKIVV